jgi:tRNA/tmRNA/rRNA uracil-C5-methylase (TrmA/RlmC/RlmD family)
VTGPADAPADRPDRALAVGDELLLETGPPAAGGSFVARADDGRVVFVRHALTGEKVRARVTEVHASWARADAVEVLRPAPDRVEPPCPYARPGRCGGCDYQHVALPRQRALKAELVAEQLRRLAGVELAPVVEEVPGAPDGLAWRTRVQFSVDPSGRAGLHRHRSRRLELVDRCLIAGDDVEAVGAERLRWPGAAAVEVAGARGQRVVSAQSRRRARASLPDLADDVGVVVDGRPSRTPHGLVHDVLGRRFEVAAGGFWQVHVGAAETLARAVLDGLDPRPGESAVDLYAGVGLFAALLAERVGATGSVVAVEEDRRACTDAARNLAGLPWAATVMAPVTPKLLRDVEPVGTGSWTAVLDPPRAGAGIDLTRTLSRWRPRRLAYVACDPASFARDLRVLLDAGWSMPSLRAFDLFPMTEHVELVALLEPPPGPPPT